MAVVLVLLSAAVVAGCGSSDRSLQPSSNSTASTASIPVSTATTVLGRTAEEAIAAYLRSSGHEYVGDCGDTNLTHDAGKYCSVMHEDRGATRIYETGPSFSEFDTWLLCSNGRMVGPSSTQLLLARPTHPTLHPGDLPSSENGGSVRARGRWRAEMATGHRHVNDTCARAWVRESVLGPLREPACVRPRRDPSRPHGSGASWPSGLPDYCWASAQLLPDAEGASSRSRPRPAVHPAVRRWCSTCGRSAEQPHRATRRPPPTAGEHQRCVECRGRAEWKHAHQTWGLDHPSVAVGSAASTGVQGRH